MRRYDAVLDTGAAARRAREALDATDWNSQGGRFVAFRLCLGLPRPAQAGGSTNCGLITYLGDLFAELHLPNHFVRGFVDRWLGWAAPATDTHIRSWSRDVDALGPTRALQYTTLLR